VRPGQASGDLMNDGQARPAAFCIVANVRDETARGCSGTEIHRGAGHFPPGAKVWVLPPQWGDGGDQVIVVGYHRGTRGRGLARIIIPRRHLTRFRVQGLYSPALINALTRPLAELGRDSPPWQWETRQQAEQIAAIWQHRATAGKQ
jgi:hypothetical protein